MPGLPCGSLVATAFVGVCLDAPSLGFGPGCALLLRELERGSAQLGHAVGPGAHARATEPRDGATVIPRTLDMWAFTAARAHATAFSFASSGKPGSKVTDP